MCTVIVVAVVLVIVGLLVAVVCGSRTWGAWGYGEFEPHPLGCLFAAIGLLALVVLGLMQIGKWFL